jgi:hypothetical protein
MGPGSVALLVLVACGSKSGEDGSFGEAGAAQAPFGPGISANPDETNPPNADDPPDQVAGQGEMACWSPEHRAGEEPDFSKPGCPCEEGASACPMFCVMGQWTVNYVVDCAVGASCQIGDLIYPTNHTRVPTPFSSCNTCTCQNGELVDCTTRECADKACEPGTWKAQRCVQCGPAGGCPVVEIGCFPDPECADGLCGQFCY